MTTDRRRWLLETLTYASFILVLDLLIALLVFFGNPAVLVLYTASNFIMPEFALLLIVGACLAAREPLDEKKKIGENGKPSKGWKAALLGKKLLGMALFLLMFGILLAVAGGVG